MCHGEVTSYIYIGVPGFQKPCGNDHPHPRQAQPWFDVGYLIGICHSNIPIIIG